MFDAIASTVTFICPNKLDHITVADPCAGAGVAVASLTARWVKGARTPEWGLFQRDDSRAWNDYARVFACELEANRAEMADALLHHYKWSSAHNRVVRGDAFLLVND